MGILPNCRDPSLQMLKKYGYNVVQLPRVDLLPTQLLVNKGGRLQRLGELTSVFVVDPKGPPVPTISADQPGPNISGSRTADLDIAVGLNILGGLISALGGSTLGVTYAYGSAHSVAFEFSSPLVNTAQLAAIDQFLGGAPVNPYARAVTEMLNDDKVYVVTGTLKARTISVTAKDAKKQAIGVNVPVIQGAIGGNIKVGGSGAGASVVTFEGAVPLVFGFQAVQLIFDNGRYRTMKLSDAGKIVAEATAAAESTRPVMSEAAAGDRPCLLEAPAMLMAGD